MKAGLPSLHHEQETLDEHEADHIVPKTDSGNEPVAERTTSLMKNPDDQDFRDALEQGVNHVLDPTFPVCSSIASGSAEQSKRSTAFQQVADFSELLKLRTLVKTPKAERCEHRGRSGLNYLPSPNRPSTSSRNAPASSAASGPVVSTSISQPLAAVSINSPMMESPGTLNPSLVTVASASNASTISTNRAEARACSPFSLRTVRTCFTGKDRPDRWSCPVGLAHVDVFSASGHACGNRIIKWHVTRLEQFQEHRNIRPAKDRPGRAIARSHREIAG